MPYKRNYRRKRYYKRKPQGYSRYMTWQNAHRALVLAKHLKTLVNVEKKVVDITESGSTFSSSTAHVGNLNICAQGDTDLTRDGAQMKMIRTAIRGELLMNGSASGTIARIIICIKKDTSGSAPSNFGSLLTSNSTRAFYDRNRIYNFKILFDKTYSLSSDKPNVAFRFAKKLQNVVRFDDVNADVASIARNGLFILALSDQATNTPTIKYHNRVTFVDN